MMKNILKRILSIVLVIILTINLNRSEHVSAQALPNILYPTFHVIEGGGETPITAFGGMTYGGFLGLIGSAITGLAYKVRVTIDNWDTYTTAFQNTIDSGGAWYTDTFWQYAPLFVNKDTGKTLEQAQADGDTINAFDYYLPLNNKIKLDISNAALENIKGMLESYSGYGDLSPGHHEGNAIQIIEDLMRYYNQYNSSRLGWKDYQYLIFRVINNDRTWPLFYVYAKNTPFTISVVQATDQSPYRTSYRLNIGGSRRYRYELNPLNGDGYSVGTIGSNQYDELQNHNFYTPDYHIWADINQISRDKLKFTNFDISYTGLITGIIRSDIENYDVPETEYEWENPNPDGLSLNINKYVAAEMEKAEGLDNLNDTDKVMEIVANADAAARENYSSVLENPLKILGDNISELIASLPASIAESIDLAGAFTPTGDFTNLDNMRSGFGNFFNFDILYEYHEMLETFFYQRVGNNSPPVFSVYLKQSNLPYFSSMPNKVDVIDFSFMEQEIFTWGITVRYFIRCILTFFVFGVWLNRTIKKLPGVVGGL